MRGRVTTYQWHLRQLMAAQGMFATTDLVAPLAERGVSLSRENRSTGSSSAPPNG